MKNQKLRTDCEIETDDYKIVYDCIDDSFDHDFGTHRQYSYEIKSVMVYLPLLDDYLDEDDIYSNIKDKDKVILKQKMQSLIQSIVDKDIRQKGYFENE